MQEKIARIFALAICDSMFDVRSKPLSLKGWITFCPKIFKASEDQTQKHFKVHRLFEMVHGIFFINTHFIWTIHWGRQQKVNFKWELVHLKDPFNMLGHSFHTLSSLCCIFFFCDLHMCTIRYFLQTSF